MLIKETQALKLCQNTCTSTQASKVIKFSDFKRDWLVVLAETKICLFGFTYSLFCSFLSKATNDEMTKYWIICALETDATWVVTGILRIIFCIHLTLIWKFSSRGYILARLPPKNESPPGYEGRAENKMETLSAGARGTHKREELEPSRIVCLAPNTDANNQGDSIFWSIFFFPERAPYVNFYEHGNYGLVDIFGKQPFLNYFRMVFFYLVLLRNVVRLGLDLWNTTVRSHSLFRFREMFNILRSFETKILQLKKGKKKLGYTFPKTVGDFSKIHMNN